MPPKPSRLNLDTYLPYRLSLASNKVSALIAKAYEMRFGLTIPQWRMLVVLSEGNALSQKQLIERTAMDKVTISRAVSALVERGLIVRTHQAHDRRTDLLSLALSGQEIVRDVTPVALEFEQTLIESVDPAHIEILHALLHHLEQRADALK